MTLIAGGSLDAKRFFRFGKPVLRGSSFDLTIGTIFNAEGTPVYEPFVLKPGAMVQVISAEIFTLPATVTGHVTYKTFLTKQGIWALTVGIVDPGWQGPVTTTLLNFSRVDYVISPGDSFLRVSFFEHEAIPREQLPTCLTLPAYTREVQRSAMTLFAPTFLNQDEIIKKAGDNAINRIRMQVLPWIAVFTLIFGAIQFFANAGRPNIDIGDLRARLDRLEARPADQSVTPSNRLPPESPPPAPNGR